MEFRDQMLRKGDVEKLDIVTNKNIVRVYIKKDSLSNLITRLNLIKTGLV
jgi:cell division protease FtsH